MWYVVHYLRRRRTEGRHRAQPSGHRTTQRAARQPPPPWLAANSYAHHMAGALWSLGTPLIALMVLAAAFQWQGSMLMNIVVFLAIAASIPESVHHAEVVALRVGEPFGTLILALAVTVIEVALIVSVMLASPESTGSLARDVEISHSCE